MIQVSVCVLSYNFEKYISQTINSIVEQETDFDFEIIICDDASTDNTQKVLKDYKDRYPELIKLILLQENTRGKQTMYRTLEHAKGKYIALIEGDDFWCNPQKLQMQYDFMENNPSHSAVVTHLNAVDEFGNQINMPKLWSTNIKKSIFTIKDYEKRPISPFIQSVFFRNKEEYTEYIRTKTSLDNFIQAMLLCDGNIGILPDTTATYRIVRKNGNNFSSMPIAKKAERLFNYALMIEEAFGDKINMENLIEQYLSNIILFGRKTMTNEQKEYLKNMTFKRKIRIFEKMIIVNIRRIVVFLSK